MKNARVSKKDYGRLSGDIAHYYKNWNLLSGLGGETRIPKAIKRRLMQWLKN